MTTLANNFSWEYATTLILQNQPGDAFELHYQDQVRCESWDDIPGNFIHIIMKAEYRHMSSQSAAIHTSLQDALLCLFRGIAHEEEGYPEYNDGTMVYETSLQAIDRILTDEKSTHIENQSTPLKRILRKVKEKMKTPDMESKIAPERQWRAALRIMESIVRIDDSFRKWRWAVRVRPYALHWLETYAKATFTEVDQNDPMLTGIVVG